MEKGDGGSSRLSTPMQQTGGDHNLFLTKSSKKEKLRRLNSIGILDEMDQLSHSKKFLDHCGRIKIHHASAPRKPRSAMKIRENESEKNCGVSDSKDEIGGSKDCTKEEEEVAEALFELAQTFNKNSDLEPVEPLHVEPQNEADVITHGNKSRKRCWVHVYICHFIEADATSVNVISKKQAL